MTATQRRSDREWRVPTTALGPVRVPKLFLGDRAFLSRYGSRFREREIESIMRRAYRQGSLGLCVSDELSARVARRLKDTHGASVLLHTPDLLTLGGRPDAGRMAGLLSHLATPLIGDKRIASDRIVGRFLQDAPTERLSSAKIRAFIGVNQHDLEIVHEWIHIAQPDAVTYGGDWIDLCLLAGRNDVIRSISSALRQMVPASCALGILSYLGACVPHDLTAWDCDFLTIPINGLADGMMPTRKAALQWARSTGVPICAIHALAMGRLPPGAALGYVFNHERAACAFVGCGTVEHLEALINGAREVLVD